MHFDDSAVQADRLDLDAHDLSMLQFLEHAIEYSALGPAIHARIDGVPIAEAIGQSAPFATVLSHVQDRIDYAQIRMAYVAPLLGQAMLDLAVLRFGDFHPRSMPYTYPLVNPSVNTP